MSSLRVSWFLAALVYLMPLYARSQARDESERWVPAFGVTSGVLDQKADASVQSGPITYNRTSRLRSPFFPFPLIVTNEVRSDPSLRPSEEGNDLLLTPVVGGMAELMTPGLQVVPGRPRFFAHGGAGAAFGTTLHIARERAPSSLPDPLPTDPYFGEPTVEGIGSETTAEVQPLVVNAGAGIAFSFDLFGRRLRVKPSVEYLREEIEVTGAVIRAVETDTGINFFPGTTLPPVPEIPMQPSHFIGVELYGDTTEVFHGIGPGLELEMDTRRLGPFVLSLFASGQAYSILGEREVTFSNDVELNDPALIPNPQTVSAEWSFEKEPWSYRAAVGLRFRWLPE